MVNIYMYDPMRMIKTSFALQYKTPILAHRYLRYFRFVKVASLWCFFGVLTKKIYVKLYKCVKELLEHRTAGADIMHFVDEDGCMAPYWKPS